MPEHTGQVVVPNTIKVHVAKSDGPKATPGTSPQTVILWLIVRTKPDPAFRPEKRVESKRMLRGLIGKAPNIVHRAFPHPMATLVLASLRPSAAVRTNAGSRAPRARLAPPAVRSLTSKCAHAGSSPMLRSDALRCSSVAGRPVGRTHVITRAQAKDASTEDSTASIAKKVQRTANACKTLGRWGFWSQLILSTVSAVIVVFSVLFKNITKATDAGLYFILFGILCAYFTTFWSLGIGKLGAKLQDAVTQLDLVPPRAEVVRQLSTGLTVNFVGLGATIVGLQATTGVLFAKSLTAAAASPFTPGGYNPVLALDIFLIQAGANVMFAHWIGAAISLWLLRTVNLPTPAAR